MWQNDAMQEWDEEKNPLQNIANAWSQSKLELIKNKNELAGNAVQDMFAKEKKSLLNTETEHSDQNFDIYTKNFTRDLGNRVLELYKVKESRYWVREQLRPHLSFACRTIVDDMVLTHTIREQHTERIEKLALQSVETFLDTFFPLT